MNHLKRGQGAVEYILFSALVSVVVFGVISPIFRDRIAGIQNRIQQTSQSVVSQTTLGIPECWFFCDSRFDPGGSSVSGVGAGGDSEQEDFGAGAGAGGPGGAGRRARNQSGQSGLGSGGASTNADEEKNRRANEQGADIGGSGGGGQATQNNPRAEAPQNDAQDDAAESGEEATESGTQRKARAQAENLRERSSGCGQIDFVTLLKLIVILAILLIVGAIALSNRGKNKGQ